MPGRDPVSAKSATAAPPELPPTFEGAMARLEDLVGQMENSRLPLEDLIRAYEEGTRLIKVCNEHLNVAEQRIEIITRDANGQTRAVEFARVTPPSGASVATNPASASSSTPPPPAPVAASRPSLEDNEVSLF